MQSYINDVYSDLFISVNIIDKGAITVLSPNSNYSTSTPDLLALDTLVQVAAKPPFTAPYRLYYYLNAAGHSGGLGMVPGGVGVGRAGFSFFDHDVQGAYNTMAHELGHCFNLSHPLHDFDQDEFPAHHIASLTGNVMSVDPWNLMGYNGSVAQRGPSRKNLRYRQWKKCKRS